jgi:enoyl-CoA hydratase/carnithine racemase
VKNGVRSERRPLEAGGVAWILTLDRPEQLNALDWETIQELGRQVQALADDDEARIAFVTGEGRAFSAGGDLKAYLTLYDDAEGFPAFLADLHQTFGELRQLRIPVVALVNGVTAAGGLELLLACDFAIAASSARIGDAHLNFGQMGGGGVLALLPRIIGIQRASELVISGRFLSANEALDWGLVNRVVADDSLLDEAMKLAEEVATKSPLAVANAKRVMNEGWLESGPLDDVLRKEREVDIEYCRNSHDAREGLNAFAEKRKPRFKGR